MSQILGDALVGGGLMCPQAEAVRRAVDAVLSGLYFYDWPGDPDHCSIIREVLRALCPEALECINEHGVRGAWKRFGMTYEEDE